MPSRLTELTDRVAHRVGHLVASQTTEAVIPTVVLDLTKPRISYFGQIALRSSTR